MWKDALIAVAGLTVVQVQGSLNLSLPPLYTLPYEDIRIRVYRDANASVSAPYYYTPLCRILPNSTAAQANRVLFKMKLWDHNLEKHVHDYVARKTGNQTAEIHLLPFHYVRFQSVELGQERYIIQQWIPIGNDPQIISGSLRCPSTQHCGDVYKTVQDEQLAADIKVLFSSKLQISQRKTFLNVAWTHLLWTMTFTAISSRSELQNYVCLQSKDYQDLVKETIEAVVENDMNVDEILENNELETMINRVSALLRPNVSSTAHLTGNWNDVFWRVHGDRPDQKAAMFTELFANNRQWMQLLMTGSLTANAANLAFPTTSETQAFLRIMDEIRDSKDRVQWNGQQFIVKPMEVRCLNLSTLRSREILGKVTVRFSSSRADYAAVASMTVHQNGSKDENPGGTESSDGMRKITSLQNALQTLSRDVTALNESCSSVAKDVLTLKINCGIFASEFNNSRTRSHELEQRLKLALTSKDSLVVANADKIRSLESQQRTLNADVQAVMINQTSLEYQIQQLVAIPIGAVVAHPKDSSLPACWLACDGQYFSTVNYPKLAALLTDQRLPDLRGRFLLGRSTVEYPLGTRGGEKSHYLTVAEMPNHNHQAGDDVNYAFLTYKIGDTSLSRADGITWKDNSGPYTRWYGTAHSGGSQAHNNMPPYSAILYIMRAC
ncbi:uncharacterized protein LOC129595598 [Paramacrobiotus metropolitanus]|uniref:uncharacterized protein LOC129595598 n=1 Tax=Paramacrobiotus metropolitanus TaxID=2943436 RepID=UPI0024459F1A|nr:uncharacterized protein LOC129595598 [Paramacrobiotus metropolitanus]